MKIKWLGHSCFLVTAQDGTKIITDPYEAGGYGGAVGYGKINETADIVTVSHDHADHNAVGQVPGKPSVVKGEGSHRTGGFNFRGHAVSHDGKGGDERGKNVIYTFEVDGVHLCHLGDLGHPLTDAQLGDLGAVDVLFIPVGGFFTIDSAQAGRICQQLSPKVVIPMHYKTPKCGFPIAPVDDFLKGRLRVKRLSASEIQLERGSLPKEQETVVLQHAL